MNLFRVPNFSERISLKYQELIHLYVDIFKICISVHHWLLLDSLSIFLSLSLSLYLHFSPSFISLSFFLSLSLFLSLSPLYISISISPLNGRNSRHAHNSMFPYQFPDIRLNSASQPSLQFSSLPRLSTWLLATYHPSSPSPTSKIHARRPETDLARTITKISRRYQLP